LYDGEPALDTLVVGEYLGAEVAAQLQKARLGVTRLVAKRFARVGVQYPDCELA
jgi:hypothetical protein